VAGPSIGPMASPCKCLNDKGGWLGAIVRAALVFAALKADACEPKWCSGHARCALEAGACKARTRFSNAVRGTQDNGSEAKDHACCKGEARSPRAKVRITKRNWQQEQQKATADQAVCKHRRATGEVERGRKEQAEGTDTPSQAANSQCM
jgi:hypothetical protein